MRRGRDVFGDCGVLGDTRWLGTYGVVADVVARTHTTVLCIPIDRIMVRPGPGRPGPARPRPDRGDSFRGDSDTRLG